MLQLKKKATQRLYKALNYFMARLALLNGANKYRINDLKKAFELAPKIYRDKKYGNYTLDYHCVHVANKQSDALGMTVALLHEIDYAPSLLPIALTDFHFSEEISQKISLLIYTKDIPYMEYIKKIKEDDCVSAIKIVDLECDLKYLNEPEEVKIEKQVALSYLLGEINGCNKCPYNQKCTDQNDFGELACEIKYYIEKDKEK